ncbi:MAG: dTDP-4-dehydrorhamnose 3,5-epimerase family protein [Jatrophihabitans sp.]|uniref:dTDP-4-dehydrorhamnose 3,5-epimerase family protein n=1 Tax=Jatrophihabitans sp. TaxID=1932789 RepID=UPI003F7EB5B2
MTVEVVPMAVEPSAIEGLFVIRTKAVTDERGTVREFFRTSGFAEAGLPVPDRWAQVNMTWTHRGGLRGLHGEAMTKLVGVAWGEAFGAYVDTRADSPTRGAVVVVPLTVGVQVLVPAGVCNGFQAVGDGGCQYVYCFDAEWAPGMPGVALNPLDPALGIAWPIDPDVDDPAMVSAKDASAPLFADLV